MNRIAFILAVLFLPACGAGMTWRLDYTFPMTVGLQVHVDAVATPPATQPAEKP